MKRLVISMSIALLLAPFGLVRTFAGARGQPARALHDAVLSGDIGLVRSVISGGADVNAKDEAGFTPLFRAAGKGQTEIAEVLITGGASVNATDQYGNTPLHFAAVQGHYAVCKVLLARGADPGAKNLTGGTALAMARAGGHNQIVGLLSGGAGGGTFARAGSATGVLQSKAPATDYVAELNRLGIAGRPESDNAAPYIQKAIEFNNQMPGALSQFRWRRPKELSAQEQALLRQWVQGNSRAFEQLQLASQKPYCWFKYSAETLQTDMGRLATIRRLAFALEARAMLRAEEGNIGGALNDLAVLYKTGALTVAGPKSLVEKLVGIAVKAVAVKAAFSIIDEKTLDVGSLKNMQSQLEGLLAADEQRFDLRGEKLVTQHMVETNPAGQVFRGHVESAFARFDATVRKTARELRSEKTDLAQDENPLVRQTGPGIAGTVEGEYRSRAGTQALVTTLAALRYKAERGAYPATLQPLVSAGYLKQVPPDPYTDKPLVYQQTGRTFKLYSFGADFDDDGGIAGKGEDGRDKNWADNGDTVFWPVEGQATADAQRLAGRPAGPPRRTNSAATDRLHRAVLPGDIKQVESAIANDADINGKDRRSWTPLHAAVFNRQKKIAELLVAQGADVNAKDNRGYTPLHLAAMKGVSDVIDLILGKGADVNATDQTGQTPLCLAAQYGHRDVVKALIAKGADVNAQTRNDNALSLARKNRRNDIVELLLEHGAKEPVVTPIGDRLYGGEEGLDEPTVYAGPQQQGRLQTGAVTESTTQVDIANILADPNEIKARIKTFEGLDKAIAQVDRRSRLEIGEWLQRRVDNRVKLAKSVELQIRAEITCVRKVAVEEKAEKTTAAINGLLADRQTRFRTLIKAMEEELKAQRPIRGRGSRGGRYGGRYSGARGRYAQDGRAGGGIYGGQAEGRGGYVGAGTGSMGVGRAPAGYGGAGTKEIPVSEWMQAGPDNRTNLVKAVQDQVQAELTPIRQVAVEEEAEKTTAAIDGVLLSRQVRLDQLLTKMGGGPAGLPGRYPGAAGSTTEQGAYPPRPRRR